MLNSLNFCLSESFWFLYQIWRRVLWGRVFLVEVLPFYHFKYIMPFPSGLWSFKSADSLMGVPLYVICHFSLVVFTILSQVFNFCQFDCYVWVCSSLGLSCLGLSVLPGLGDYFLSHVWEVFSYYLFKYFLRSFSTPSGTPIMWMLVCLMLFRRSLRLSSFLFVHLYSVLWQWFLPFCPLGHLLFCLIILQLIPSVLFISLSCSLVLVGLW